MKGQAPFVEVDGFLHMGGVGNRESKRSGAGAGRAAEMVDALAYEPFNEISCPLFVSHSCVHGSALIHSSTLIISLVQVKSYKKLKHITMSSFWVYEIKSLTPLLKRL